MFILLRVLSPKICIYAIQGVIATTRSWKKYYVVFEEGDEELSEDEERRTQQDTEALTPVTVQAFFPL